MKNSVLGMWAEFLGLFVLAMAGLYLLSYSTAYFEGIGSIILLIAGVLAIWRFGRQIIANRQALILFFIAWLFLGVMFDAAGNFIYNKPFQMFCPAETIVTREAVSEENYEGNIETNQYFSCYSMTQGKIVKEIPRYLTTGVRAIEYLLLGSILVGFYWLISRSLFKKTRQGGLRNEK